MTIEPHLITGFSLAIEYVSPQAMEDDLHTLVVDLGILRLMFMWDAV